MEYLAQNDFLLINKKTIERHGGTFTPPSNFLNKSSLDYVLEAVEAKMFGKILYPEIHQKAALYMYNIITNHIFQDGNKRTGLEAAILFLRLNKYNLKEKLVKIVCQKETIPSKGNSSTEILIEFTLEIAEGRIKLEECQKWFEKNTQEFT
jgi:death-on-curing protein